MNPENHAFQVFSGRGELLWEQERSSEYNKYWYSIERLSSRRVSRKEFKQHVETFNPAKIVGVYDLITVEAAQVLSEIEAEDKLLSSVMLEPMAMMSGGGSPTDFMFTSLVKNTNDTLSITVECLKDASTQIW